MSEVLDLDILIPEPKKVKISGKIIDCYPPKIRQLLSMQMVWDKIKSADSSEAEQLLIDVLAPIVPAIKDDKDLDFTIDQLTTLLQYAQNIAIPDNLKTNVVTTEKKTASPKPSPTS